MKFNDEQMINSTLLSLKYLRIMYTYFTEETGTPELFSKANQLLSEVTEMQRATYDLMVEKGFINVTFETSNKIQTTYGQLKTIVEEMN